VSEAEAILYMDAVKRILEEDSEAARRSGDHLKIKGQYQKNILFTKGHSRTAPEDEAGEDEVKMILDLAELLEDRLAAGKISKETYSQLRGKSRWIG
jgi:hypothetical protein